MNIKTRVYYGKFNDGAKCYVVTIQKGNMPERFLTYDDDDTGRKRVRTFSERLSAEKVAKDIIKHRRFEP